MYKKDQEMDERDEDHEQSEQLEKVVVNHEESELQEILRLRYGIHNPTRRNKALFSVPCVAEYMGIERDRCQRLIDRYFYH